MPHTRIAAVSVFALATAAAAAAPDGGVAQLTWLGHAAFEIVSPAGAHLLTDPWLAENPKAPPEFKKLERFATEKPTAILVTHAHGDHADDVPFIAKVSGAPVIATGEHLRAMKIAESQQWSINVGGQTKMGDVTIFAVPAMHSSEPGGRPLGYVLQLTNGQVIYQTGDTAIFGDMALIEELYHPTIILLTCGGGRWGMNPSTAALAVKKYFKPKLIIPMHYGTNSDLASEAEVVAAFKGDKRVHVMTPGQTISLSP
jgi:L-ascorbate metabolism protein UlaG (beta-lactamase superfamily)